MADNPERGPVKIGDLRSGAAAEDVVDRRPTPVVDRRVLAGMLIVVLAVALGFLAGRNAGSGAKVTKSAASQVSVTTTADSQLTTTKFLTREITVPRPAPAGPFNQIIATGARCSVQKGHQLQLGVEVRDELDVPITLVAVRVPYAAGDELRPVGSARGACAELPGYDTGINGYLLAVGTSVWLTVTLDVLTGCPRSDHPMILLDYSQTGRAVTTMVGGFPDLGDVPYSGCN